MPTPFYHLSVAEQILMLPDLPEAAGVFLQRHRAAFLLGNTATDVQTLTGQDRQATHFYDLPVEPGDKPAWERLLVAYPELAQSDRLPENQAAFLAGYMCHLQADWNWVIEIFSPVFGPDNAWQTYRQRLYLHNVLRSYLDFQILPELAPHIVDDLGRAAPEAWLPFIEDDYLVRWRDFLAGQLCDGCTATTVEVFAARQGVSPENYYEMLRSEERLDREIFTHLPRWVLEEYRQKLLFDNIRLLSNYLYPFHIQG